MKPSYEDLETKCALLQSKLAAMNELMNVVGKASDIVNGGSQSCNLRKLNLRRGLSTYQNAALVKSCK